MSSRREIIILANSAKKGGCCVAGKDIETGEWIRPVSNKDGAELTREQATLTSSQYTWMAKSLNKVIINFDSRVPQINQPENFLIDSSAWIPNYKVDRSKLDELLDNPEHIWMYGPYQDHFKYEYFERGMIVDHQSLYLIKVESIVFTVVSNASGQKRVKGAFEYKQLEYSFNVTDRAYCKYKNFELGFTFTEHSKYLCLSLGEKYSLTGHCYKLIAAVI
ncbi:hypothetical protein ACFLR3_00965 [Campylobacterota bacterium]